MAGKTTNKSDARKESFAYLLEMLKLEMQTLENIVSRLDEMAQTTKNWTITIWTGSLAIALSQPDYRKYIMITAIAPILFWYIDSHFRHLQRRSIYRGQKISDYLNSPKLVESFEKGQFIDFKVSDLTATQYREFDDYKKFVSKTKTFMFPEVATFYAVLTGISILMGIYFLLTP